MDMPQIPEIQHFENVPSPQPAQPQLTEPKQEGLKSAVIMTSVFVILWVFVGLAAFIMSLVCFGRSGSTVQHIIGLLLSIFFGPFYWIYYFAASSYCKKVGGKKTFRG